MPILQLIVLLAIVGVVLYAINAYVPMEATMKRILNIVIIIVVCLFLLNLVGLLPDLGGMKVGK